MTQATTSTIATSDIPRMANKKKCVPGPERMSSSFCRATYAAGSPFILAIERSFNILNRNAPGTDSR